MRMNRSEFGYDMVNHPTNTDDEDDDSYSNLSSIGTASSCDDGMCVSSSNLAVVVHHLKDSLDALTLKVDQQTSKMQAVLTHCQFKVSDSVDETKNLLELALDLRLRTLVSQCVEMLKNNLSHKNCIELYKFGVDKSLMSLKVAAYNFVLNHFTMVSKEEDFTKLEDVSIVKAILGSDALNVDSEETVFRAMMDWIKTDLTHRRPHVECLIPLLRLPLCEISFLNILKEHFLLYQLASFHKEIQDTIKGLESKSEEMTAKIQSAIRKPRL